MHWHTIFADPYAWLVANGIWRSVIGVLTATLIAWLLRLGKRLRKIEHLLDTEKPGGLTDVVNAINAVPGTIGTDEPNVDDGSTDGDEDKPDKAAVLERHTVFAWRHTR